MSQENNNQPRNEGGQRRQGNNNRNRNRNRNNQGGNRNQQGGRQQGRQSGGGPKSPQRRHQRKPLPLTTWEKVLKFFGLYKEPTRPPRRQSGNQPESASPEKAKKSPKSNTRNTRDTRGKSAQGDDRREKRDYPVDTPRLYLGNLSYDADEASLEELFKGAGTVRSVEIVYNRHTHRSKGFGFIEMQSVEEAKRAVQELHGKDFMGRNLVVNGASNKPKADSAPPRERKPRENKPSRERSERRERPASKSRLHIDNLSFDVDESSVEELFKGVGNVRRVEIVRNRETHRSKGFGFVEMQKTEDSQRAIEVLHDQPFMGRKLVVTEAKNKTQDSNASKEAAQPETQAEPQAEVTPATETPEPAVEAPATEAPATEAPVEAPVEAPAEPIVEAAVEPAEEPAKTTAE